MIQKLNISHLYIILAKLFEYRCITIVEFKRSSITSHYLPFAGCALIGVDTLYMISSPEKTIVHEWMHKLFPGFNNRALNEGMTSLLTDMAAGVKAPDYYNQEVKMMEEIADQVELETLMEAYATGSYKPLKDKLGPDLIELFELSDLVRFTSPDIYRLLSTTFISAAGIKDSSLSQSIDPITLIIWESWKNKTDTGRILRDNLKATFETVLGI